MPFSFTERGSPGMKPPQPTPADIAAMARDGGVKQVATSSWETFTQVYLPQRAYSINLHIIGRLPGKMAANMPVRLRMVCRMATGHGQVLLAAAIEVDGAMAFFTDRARTHGEVVIATQEHI